MLLARHVIQVPAARSLVVIFIYAQFANVKMFVSLGVSVALEKEKRRKEEGL